MTVLVLAIAAIITSLNLPAVEETEEQGLISWYGGDFFRGRTTASGEKYNEDAMRCASRHLPFGTLVILTEERTGAHSYCLVNDRGPYGALLENGEWVKKFRRKDPGTWRAILDVTPAVAWRLAAKRKRRHIYGMRAKARIFRLSWSR